MLFGAKSDSFMILVFDSYGSPLSKLLNPSSTHTRYVTLTSLRLKLSQKKNEPFNKSTSGWFQVSH